MASSLENSGPLTSTSKEDSEDKYGVLPDSYLSQWKYPIHPIPVSYPLIQANYAQLRPEHPIDYDQIKFTEEGYLTFPYMFVAHAEDAILKIQLEEESPLAPALAEYHLLARQTPIHHQDGRALLQNCSRSLLFVHRAWLSGLTQGEDWDQAASELYRIFKKTRGVLEGIPFQLSHYETIPELTEVSVELHSVISRIKALDYMCCRFPPGPNGRLLRVPIIIHPYLDFPMENLQLILIKAVSSIRNQNALIVAYQRIVNAFEVVNRSLFSNPEMTEEKSYAFGSVITEFRRWFSLNSSITYKIQARWLIIPLLSLRTQQGLLELDGYLSDSVKRITVETLAVETNDLENAMHADTMHMEDMWKMNIAIAAREKCTDIFSCEAVRDLPQWAMKDASREDRLLAAEEAWRRMRSVIPGTYEYRALGFAANELRRNTYPSLRVWEFLEQEVQLQDPLGQGGFADVFRCQWLKGVAAIKVFRQTPSLVGPGLTLSTKQLDTFLHQREMETWFRLSHPHVLPFLGACTTSSVPMILTPLAANGTARDYRSSHGEADWIRILTQVASGVHYLHKFAAIIHGDLKGFNILIDSSGSPLISDFGLAKMVQNIYGRINRSGGTAQWMAPELLKGGPLTFMTDVYALAMTFYELWLDKNPFDYLENDLVQEMVVEEEMRPAREDDPTFPDNMWELLEACWVVDPDARPSSATVYTRMEAINGGNPDQDVYLDPTSPIQDHPVHNPPGDEHVSIENLSCTHLHQIPSNPKRPDFPFVSSGHLVSFAVRPHFDVYETPLWETSTCYIHLETSPDAIRSSIEHPIEKLIFRVQSVTKRPEGFKMWDEENQKGFPTRLEAMLLRRNPAKLDDWEEVMEAATILLDHNVACNATVMHVMSLGSNSPISRHATSGDKIGLRVVLGRRWKIEIEMAEIEMHVRLDPKDHQEDQGDS